MRKISILMSIYNETIDQIVESIMSILHQTFSEFVSIIVLDSPERDISDLIQGFHDERIVFIRNSKNMGLALSMNRAASLSSTKILARMDADDVALQNRLEVEYNILVNNNIDFVFSNYNTIDGDSKIIEESSIQEDFSNPEELRMSVSLAPSIIHHPTVMFTKSLFEKVGGYRNFPCAQDSDLWLRMAEAGCRFYKVGTPLLNYRINPNSITNKRWFLQQLTGHYILTLSMERLEKGVDSFSSENYQRFLNSNGINSLEEYNRLKRSTELLRRAKLLKKEGCSLLASILRVRVFFMSAIYRKSFLLSYKKKIKLKYGSDNNS